MDFLEELKRRRVVRAALVYTAVGWAVVEAADVFVPALQLPQELITAVALVVLLGFPLAMALAWAFDITPEGVKRAASAREAAPPEVQGRSHWVGVRTMAVVGTALLIGGALGWGARSSDFGGARAAEADPEPDRSSVAVLPFVDLSPDGGESYLGDGVAEELLNVLAQVPGLRVAARTSAFSFRGDVDLRDVGRSLGVATVMEGSVRRQGDSVRITAQLIDAATGYHLFSNDYDRELGGLVEVQEEIATAIARELRLPLRIGLDASGAARTADPQAYDHYLRGLDHFHRRDVRRAASSFRRALDRDSAFSGAWAQLAQAEALKPYYREGTWSESLDTAERAARRALALDPASAAALTALANVHRDRWEWAEAEAAYRRALALSPDDPELVDQYGQHLVQLARFDQAADRLEHARDMDPLAWVHPASLGWAHFLARRYDDGERAWRRAIALDPSLELPRVGLFYLLHAAGRTDRIAAESALFEDLDTYVAWQRRGEGPAEEARIRAWFEELRGTSGATSALEAAIVAERWDLFFELLRTWSRDRAGNTHFLWLPQLDAWRDDPRFQAAITGLDLPDPPPGTAPVVPVRVGSYPSASGSTVRGSGDPARPRKHTVG